MDHILEAKECVRCGEGNPVDYQYCGKCGLVLDGGEALAAQERDAFFSEFAELLKEAEMRQKFLGFLKSLT